MTEKKIMEKTEEVRRHETICPKMHIKMNKYEKRYSKKSNLTKKKVCDSTIIQ